MRSIRRSAAALLAASLVLAACNGDDEPDEQASQVSVLGVETSEEPEADEDPEPDTEPEADPEPDPEPDPDPEPQEPAAGESADNAPDAEDGASHEFVDSVMDRVLSESADVLVSILNRDGGTDLEDEEVQQLEAVYSGPRLQAILDEYRRYAEDEAERTGLLAPDNQEQVYWDTRQVVEANDGCIVAVGSYDLSNVALDPPPDDLKMVVSLESGTNARASDEEHWRMRDINAVRGGDGNPIPPDEWGDLDFLAVLDHTCDPEDAS